MYMKKKTSKFIIYRVYQNDRIKNYQIGWTYNKSIAKLFIDLRGNEKYKVLKVSDYELAQMDTDDTQDKSSELKLFQIFCKSENSNVVIVSTDSEINEYCRKLYIYFTDELASLSALPNHTIDSQIKLFTELKNEYIEALEEIGFSPKELRYMDEDDLENEHVMNSLKNIISPSEDDYRFYFGHDVIEDWAKCIYSLEGLMMVWKEEF